ncbi:MAG: CPBP family intramembrane glutamic endopeptidase [bacterium]
MPELAEKPFDWGRTSQLSIPQILLAVFAPSAVATIGFHGLLPRLVAGNTPVLIAWPAVASAMLAVLVLIAFFLLQRDARQVGVTLRERLCLRWPSGREWLLSLGVFVLAIALTLGGGLLVPPLLNAVGFEIPAYMPFFLNPGINPMEAGMEVISPGLPLAGRFDLIPLIALTLFLNILAEDIYFRAWMLPKMARHGGLGWVANGVLFAAYHTFQLWMFPMILGVTLCMAYLVYKTRSIWPSFALHAAINALSLMGIVVLIMR